MVEDACATRDERGPRNEEKVQDYNADNGRLEECNFAVTQKDDGESRFDSVMQGHDEEVTQVFPKVV